MERPSPTELELAAQKAFAANTQEESLEHLSHAFTLFSKESYRLQNLTANLQEELCHVNQELKKKNQEIQKTTYFLNNILQNITDGIVFLDLEGTIALINPAAEGMLKIDAQKALFQKFWTLFQDDYFGFSMKEALQFGIAHRLLYKTLEEREVEISSHFIYKGAKIYHGLIVWIRDISEKQKLQMIASHNDRIKELGMMAATVAHEIRNPLGGIRGFASLLVRDLQDNEHLQEMASHILDGTKALEKLVSKVLSYTRPMHIDPKSMDISSFLRKVGKFVQVDPAFIGKVKLKMHIPEIPLLAPIDPESLKSALLNLLFNALQAMPYGGEVTLSLLKLEYSCQISVSDTGVGIEEEKLKEIFSPFFTTKSKGNGLGLVETEKIVRAHFGSIEVRSKVGKGATFTITLPLKR